MYTLYIIFRVYFIEKAKCPLSPEKRQNVTELRELSTPLNDKFITLVTHCSVVTWSLKGH